MSDLARTISGGFGSSGFRCVYGTVKCADEVDVVNRKAEVTLDEGPVTTSSEAAGL